MPADSDVAALAFGCQSWPTLSGPGSTRLHLLAVAVAWSILVQPAPIWSVTNPAQSAGFEHFASNSRDDLSHATFSTKIDL